VAVSSYSVAWVRITQQCAEKQEKHQKAQPIMNTCKEELLKGRKRAVWENG